jgi:hypothetical protein
VFAIQDTGDVMGNSGHDFASAGRGQVCKQRRGKLTPHVGKGIAVKEKERGSAMALPQEIYGFFEGKALLLPDRPLACTRRLSLAIKAVLRASSCARSPVEADDKLPTPVLEKLGSGL